MEKKNKTTKILMHDIPLRLIKVLNIICLTIPFAGCWYGYYSGQMKDGFYNRGNLLMIALFMLVYFLFARIYGKASSHICMTKRIRLRRYYRQAFWCQSLESQGRKNFNYARE